MTILLEGNEYGYPQIHCKLCPMKEGKAKTQIYLLQMINIPDWPFNMIAIDLITDLNVSTSGNQHILFSFDHLMGWQEAFLIPNKSADTIVCVFINNYLTVHMYPMYILSDNGMELQISLWMMYSNNLASIVFSQPRITHRAIENWRYSKSILNTHSRNCVRITCTAESNA